MEKGRAGEREVVRTRQVPEGELVSSEDAAQSLALQEPQAQEGRCGRTHTLQGWQCQHLAHKYTKSVDKEHSLLEESQVNLALRAGILHAV